MMFSVIEDKETRKEVENTFNTLPIGAFQETYELYGATVEVNDGKVVGVGGD